MQAHPLYVEVKRWACCRLLNFVGQLWFAVWLAAMLAVPLAVALLVYIARLDSLPPHGCAPHSHRLSRAPKLLQRTRSPARRGSAVVFAKQEGPPAGC